MSWDTIVFDIFTPKVKGTLSTQELQYSNESMVSSTATCRTACQCGEAPGFCTPIFNDVCQSAPSISSKIQSITGEQHSKNNMGCGENICYYQLCTGINNQRCAKIEDSQTCTMGEGKGQIEGTPTQGVNWNLQDYDNYKKGWIMCTYNWDYSQYNNSNVPFGPTPLYNMLKGIVFDKNPAGDSLSTEMKNRILSSNIVYATILDFYNQLYSQGWYGNRTGVNPFYSVDYLGEGMGDFITSVINELEGRTNGLFPLSIFPPDLHNSLQTVLLPPSPRQRTDNPEVYELTLYLSYSLYQTYVSSQTKDSFFNFLVSSLLRDSEGKMQSQDTLRSWTPDNPEFENSTLESLSAIQLSPNYLVKTGIKISDFTPQNYPNFIFATARVTATVKKWSPMLAAYFQAFNQNINFSINTCNLIANSGTYPSTVPTRCLTNDCEDYNDRCKASMVNYCNFSYTAPANTTTLEELLVQNNNKNCYCYSSRVAPSREKSSGMPSAMCFSSNCPEKLLAMFNLDDSKCQDYCSTVYNWMNSTDPSEHCQNCDELDKDKLSRLCPLYNNPITNTKINLQVLFIGIVISIMTGLLSFSICKNKEYTGMTTSLVIFISSSIILGLSVFLSFELHGKSICDGKTFKCYSGLSGTQIPLEFCSEALPCECSLNNDCESKSCVCVSSACLPTVGTRASTTVYERKISWVTIIAGGICMIVLPLILIYLHDDYHWNISKTIYGIILLLLAVGPITYIIYRNVKKYPRTVFVGSCNSCISGCPVGSSPCGDGNDCVCCDDSSICSSGTCINTNKYYIFNKNYPTYFLSIDLTSDQKIINVTNDPQHASTYGWRIKKTGDNVHFILEQNNQVYYMQAYGLYPRYININDPAFDPKDPNILWNFDKEGRISTSDNSNYIYIDQPSTFLALIGPNDQPQNPTGYVWLTSPV